MRAMLVLMPVLLAHAALAAQPPEVREMAHRIVPEVAIDSDEEFFAAWDLDRPGLEAVQAAVEAGDYPAAKVALKQYFLDRREPVWKRNHWEMPAEPRGEATAHSAYAAGEKILAHQFEGGGFEVDFGDRIDWNYFPKILPNGKPDTEYPVIHSINRFGHLKTLGALYWYSRDERYAREFVYEVTDHVQSNPAPEGYIRFTSVWSRLTACVPLLGSWLDAWNYFLPSESFAPDDVAIMLKGFIQKARYAVVAPDGVNRYMAQIVAIYNVGAYFPELKQAADFRDFAVLAMRHAVRDEFYPDGFSRELCPGYHGGSRSHINSIIASARLMGYEPPLDLEDTVRASYEIYPAIMTPLMGLPQFGDTWGTGDLQRVFAAIEPGRWDDPVHDWIASGGGEGSPPAFTSTRLPWAGYYAMRSGWDRDARYLCFDAGPLGAGHWHEDFGNFEMYAFGERLISDMAVHSYTLDDMHKYFYSSLAHNVVLVDGLTQTRAAEGQYRGTDAARKADWHSDEVFDLAWGRYDALWAPWETYHGRGGDWGKSVGQRLATHRRDICFVRDDYWIISDRLEAPGEHTFSQLFHLRPDREAQVFDARSAGTAAADRPNVVLLQADETPATVILGREDPPQGWVATDHGHFAPAPCISFDVTTTDRAWYDTIVLPLPAGAARAVTVERIPVTDVEGALLPVAEVCALRISGPWGVDIYLNDLRQAEVGPPNGMLKRFGERTRAVETDARAAVIRLTAEGELLRASAVGASTLTVAGEAL